MKLRIALFAELSDETDATEGDPPAAADHDEVSGVHIARQLRPLAKAVRLAEVVPLFGKRMVG